MTEISLNSNERVSGQETLVWVVLETLLVIGASVSGLLLMREPTGASLGLPAPTDMLRLTPFHDYFWPGFILFFANGLLPAVAIALNLTHRRTSALANFVVATVLTGWMFGQLLLVAYTSFVQVVMLGYGLFLPALARG